MNDSTLAQDVYRRIKHLIVTCQLLPGTPLQEQELSESMEVSRTPIREALRTLASEGLVEIRAHRGARVAHISRQDLLDAYEAREWLEPVAAAKAAQRIDAATLEKIEAVIEKMLDEPSTHEEAVQALQADLEFHKLIMNAAGNRFVLSFVNEMRAINQRAAYFVPPGRYHQSKEEHRAILDAMRAHNTELTERLMREHIKAAASRMFLFSSNQFSLISDPISTSVDGEKAEVHD